VDGGFLRLGGFGFISAEEPDNAEEKVDDDSLDGDNRSDNGYWNEPEEVFRPFEATLGIVWTSLRASHDSN